MIPQTVGNYRVTGPLGKGSTGVIYRAARRDSNLPVALKAVEAARLPTAEARQQFIEEAESALLLTHPRLRQLYDVIESEGNLYLALEYLDGATLKNLLVSGPVALEAALAWGAELADGLAAAHEHGVVHGELTPAKVFVTQEGTVKLLDPGLWRLAVPTGVDLSQEANLEQAQLLATTVAALAPEQIAGNEPDDRSDIFALGALVYQMVTGRNPFLEPSLTDTMHCVLQRTPEPVSQLIPQAPVALDAVLAKALEKEPEKRYSSAGELAGALRAVAAGEEVPRPEMPPPEPPPEEAAVEQAKRLTLPYLIGIGGLALLLVIWLLYLALTR
ncbi:MAG: serine/threonine-protein kinase [Candidatus Acidiferrales bacterium]